MPVLFILCGLNVKFAFVIGDVAHCPSRFTFEKCRRPHPDFFSVFWHFRVEPPLSWNVGMEFVASSFFHEIEIVRLNERRRPAFENEKSPG